jgi:hypothetical protein
MDLNVQDFCLSDTHNWLPSNYKHLETLENFLNNITFLQAYF